MTAGARWRRGLVIHAIAMTGHAGLAIDVCGRFVCGVAGRAAAVLWDAMQTWERRGRVAARAARGRGRSAGSVRTMTGRARDGSPVGRLCRGRMAARAARGGATRIVRLMTARACLVAGRRGRRFGAVTRCAYGGWRAGCVGRVRMAGRAACVTGAGRRSRAVGVAAHAQRQARGRLRAVRGMAQRAVGVTAAARSVRAIGVAATARRRRARRLAAVRRVAREAGRGGMRRGLVAGLARHCLGGRRERARMDRMTTGAGPGGARRMGDHVAMTARAGARAIAVGRVAGRTRRVRCGCDDRLAAMTCGARQRLRRAELVRLVAAGAALVARGQRLAIDVKRAGLIRMAAHAAAIRGELRLVDTVAVEAASRAGVLGLLRGVARRARRRRERRLLVRAMTAAARLVGVRADRVQRALRAIVAAHARGASVGDRGRGTERVTVPAARRVAARVQRRDHGRVAPCAQRRRRPGEARVAVARRARDLATVCDVARTRTHGEVRGRDLFGRGRRSPPTRAGDDRDRDDGRSDHGRDPMGWHRRHGSDDSGTRLDHPPACGLPPMPPTL